MRTRSQGPPESVVPTTRRQRRRRGDQRPDSSDAEPDRDVEQEEAPAVAGSHGRSRSCPPLRRSRVGRLAVRQPLSPAAAARRLFASSGTVPQPVAVQQPVAMMAAAAKYPKFVGKTGEDPDAHVRKFDKIYGLDSF